MVVAPSRVRGLKHSNGKTTSTIPRRTLTGAWIETYERQSYKDGYWSRTLTGAWIETMSRSVLS